MASFVSNHCTISAFLKFNYIMNNFLLDFLALGAILSGILVITRKNPVISVLFLISVFVNVAGYLVLLGVGFIGISYLIVYVGAIAILFLFVVMMLNLQLAELSAVGSEYTQNLPLGAIVGSLFLIELISILPSSFKGTPSSSFNLRGDAGLSSVIPSGSASRDIQLGFLNWMNSFILGSESEASRDSYLDIHQAFNPMSADTYFANFLQIQSIGQNLYTYGALWLLLTSFILLLAMVGPITLSMRKSNN